MDERTDQVTSHESTRDIRRDIERTQREMSQTIDEIQYRLSPRHLKEQTKESVRRAGLRTSRGVMDHVKGNPIGAAMVGVGLMLLMRNPHRDDYEYDVDFEADFDDSRYYGGEGRTSGYGARPYADRGYAVERGYGISTASEFEHEGRLDEMKDRLASGVDSARERASEMTDEMRDKAHHATERARLAADRARMRARTLRSRSAERADRLRNESRDFMMETPLIAGLAGIALGAIVGALIPESERENELFGEKSDRVVHRAGALAKDALDHGKDIARAATGAAADAAKREAANAKDELKQNVSDTSTFR